jgi:hypothetical protein
MNKGVVVRMSPEGADVLGIAVARGGPVTRGVSFADTSLSLSLSLSLLLVA